MSDPIMPLSDKIVCKFDDEYGPNKHGWDNQPWMDTPFCIDKNAFCDFCITETIRLRHPQEAFD